MKHVAYARYHLNKLELRRDPFPGFWPLIFAPSESASKPAYVPRPTGWKPDDRTHTLREFLKGKPYGATRQEILDVLGIKRLWYAAEPLRKTGELRYWPIKGRGAKWYLCEYEDNVKRAWEEHCEMKRKEEAERAVKRYNSKKSFADVSSVWMYAA